MAGPARCARQDRRFRRALKKERSDSARAAMISGLERLGDDVSDFFDSETMIREAEAGLSKGTDKALAWFPLDLLPALHWRDGTAVDPRLPRWWLTLASKLKQPGGNALIDLWLDRLAPGDAHRLGWMVLTGWIEQDIKTCTVDEANAYAAANVATMLQQNQAMVQRHPQASSYWSTDRDVIFEHWRMKLGTYLGARRTARASWRSVRASTAPMRRSASGRSRITARVSPKPRPWSIFWRATGERRVAGCARRRQPLKQRSLQAHADRSSRRRRAARLTTEELTDRTILTAGPRQRRYARSRRPDRAYALRSRRRRCADPRQRRGQGSQSPARAAHRRRKPLIDAAKS